MLVAALETPIGTARLWCERVIGAQGRLMRDMYYFEVKAPADSRYDGDYLKQLASIPAEKAFRPADQSECPLLKK